MKTYPARALLVILFVAAMAVPAWPRSSPNPAGRLILDPAVIRVGTTSVAPAHATPAGAIQSSPALLPSGAVQLDSTWYDLQDMGSLGTRLVIGVDGRVHATWQDDFCELDAAGCPPNLNAPQPHPQRGMGYSIRSAAGGWTHLGKVVDPDIRGCCLTELFGGFGSLAVTADGRAAVAQHLNEEGCDLRGNFYLEDAAGGPTWTAYLTPIISPSYLFPQVAASPGGSFVVLGEVPRGGSYDETNEFRISRLAAAGQLFACPTGWQCGPWTAIAPSTLYRDGRPAFPVIAAASDGRVGVAVTDFGGNVFLIESSNGTFDSGTVTIRNLTNYTDGTITASDSTSTQYRPYIHSHVAYNDTTPHVVWSELQARRSGSSIVYLDHRSRVMHWSSPRGITVVTQVQAGEADRYDDLDLGLSGPISGFNTISVDWPQVGFSSDGSEIYVAWLRFVDAEIDPTADAGAPGLVTGVGFGDIACSVARGAETWSIPQNLTQTPGTDERFVSLAAHNPGGDAHVLFQASATNQAGVAIIGDRGPSSGNLLRRIAYLERPLAASVVSVVEGVPNVLSPLLRAYPSPSGGPVRFAIERRGAPATLAFVDVLSAAGRRVARVPLQGEAASWDGRDLQGRLVPSGLYFARLEGQRPEIAAKFLVLH